MIEFCNDDDGYLAWIGENPGGFVWHVRRQRDSTYVILHRASCNSISSDLRTSGAYTARAYRKVCALNLEELQLAARKEGRHDGSFSKKCSQCRP